VAAERSAAVVADIQAAVAVDMPVVVDMAAVVVDTANLIAAE
jgi:hypothetical protein